MFLNILKLYVHLAVSRREISLWRWLEEMCHRSDAPFIGGHGVYGTSRVRASDVIICRSICVCARSVANLVSLRRILHPSFTIWRERCETPLFRNGRGPVLRSSNSVTSFTFRSFIGPVKYAMLLVFFRFVIVRYSLKIFYWFVLCICVILGVREVTGEEGMPRKNNSYLQNVEDTINGTKTVKQNQ